ncbi:MAG: uroporphyrinogen decarboxylase family protein [Candidatus Thorarchaeota archaeon]
MKPRERVHTAVRHEEPDRVPLDYWTTPQAYEKLRDYLGITAPETQEWGIMSNWKTSEELLKRLNVDFRRVYMNPAEGFEPQQLPDGSTETEFKCGTKLIGGYYEVTYFPWAEFTEVEQVEDFEWINPEDPSRMEGVREWARHLHEETDYAVVGMVGGPWGAFEVVAHYMRGFDKFLIDLLRRTDLAEAMMEKSTQLALDMNRVLLDEVGEYLDIVQVGDDLGHQDGLLINPRIYRTLVKPRHKKIYSDIHRRSPHVKILYHSCGAIEPMIEDLIEVDVDILNPIQPLAKGMDSVELKRKYGDKLTFHGGIDLQVAMAAQGTMEDVRNEVDTRLQALAPGGGYILAPAHNIQPESTPEKILELYDYASKKGVYPIRV